MSWPLSQDYNEAIQDPRGNFSDAELRAGEAVANALGIPMPRSGNFADVYEVRCPSGARWAVKCFTREVHGLRERYAEISDYLRQVNLPFMVDFQYLEEGIRVRNLWYPILKMQWVEGFVLNEFVRDNLDKKPILQALGQIWLRMARRLRRAKLAHGDLQHGNVLFVPGSSAHSLAVKLIDYDGMCVPSLIGKNSGEVGHPAYQHPERLRTGAYNQEIDRFSLLSIAAALRCLTVGGGSLWERYDTGDNLLFRQADLQAPAASPLFRELQEIGDPQAQILVKELYRACQGPLAEVPSLTDLLPEEKPSRAVTAAGRRAATAEEAEWDFGDEEPSTPFLRQRPASSGMPLWLWGVLGGAAAILISVALGAGLFPRNHPDRKEETSLVKHMPSVNSSTAKQATQSTTNPDDSSTDPKSVDSGTQTENLAGGIFCLTPAGDKLAISDNGEKDWRLIDPRTNKLLQRFSGHTEPVTHLAFSADGSRAVTSGGDGMLRLWDVQTGQMIGERKVHKQPVLSLALSPDGTKAVDANGSVDVELWDFEAKKGHGYHNNRKVRSVAISPDGHYLVCGYDQSDDPEDLVLLLWPLFPEGKPLRLGGPAKTVTNIAVSPDGKYVAASQNGNAPIISLWETATGKLVRQHSMPSVPIHQLAFSPDGRFLLALAENRFQLWAVAPVPKGGIVSRGGGDSVQELVTAAFNPGKEEATLVYRKGSGIGRVQTVILPKIVSSDGPLPTSSGKPIIWDAPVDPDRDCTFRVSGGKLTIAVPGKDHDLGAERGQMNAPRLLCDVEGDFTAQVRVSGDFQPSTDATVAGKIPVVGAGLVLLLNEKTYVRLERFGWYREKKFENLGSWELRRDARMTFSRTSPLLTAKESYLRMERRGEKLLGSLSEDGQKWIELPPIDIVLPQKVKLGIDAISTSTRPFAPAFDQFQLKQARGEIRRVDWPSLPAKDAVVEKPQKMEEPDSWAHLDLPNDLIPDPKDPILRIPKGRVVATRQDYTGPLDITIVLRGPLDQDLSLSAPGAATLTIRRSRRGQWSHLLNVRRPTGPDGETGGLPPIPPPLVWPANKWCTLHWEIKPNGMRVTINKQPIFQEAVRYNLSAKDAVKIEVHNATVEVKSLTVKSLKK